MRNVAGKYFTLHTSRQWPFGNKYPSVNRPSPHTDTWTRGLLACSAAFLYAWAGPVSSFTDCVVLLLFAYLFEHSRAAVALLYVDLFLWFLSGAMAEYGWNV